MMSFISLFSVLLFPELTPLLPLLPKKYIINYIRLLDYLQKKLEQWSLNDEGWMQPRMIQEWRRMKEPLEGLEKDEKTRWAASEDYVIKQSQ